MRMKVQKCLPEPSIFLQLGSHGVSTGPSRRPVCKTASTSTGRNRIDCTLITYSSPFASAKVFLNPTIGEGMVLQFWHKRASS